mmetsp:Transcript_7363/g.10534  ORF Transcript_7363/g.10534 Transcript_7363/m.10534 type:complete len:102 (-) Transcript_7363:386-691(-)
MKAYRVALGGIPARVIIFGGKVTSATGDIHPSNPSSRLFEEAEDPKYLKKWGESKFVILYLVGSSFDEGSTSGKVSSSPQFGTMNKRIGFAIASRIYHDRA